MLSQLYFLLLVPGLPMAVLFFWMRSTAKKRDQQFRRPFDEMPRPAGYSLQMRTAAIMDKFTEDYSAPDFVAASNSACASIAPAP